MRLVRALIAILTISIPAAAQQFVHPAPDPSTVRITRDAVYSGELRFDLYRPASDAVVPVVVFANIGNSGMKNWPGYIGWGNAVAAAGLAAVHYDAANGKAIESFDALMNHLRSNADAHRIDTSRVVIWGGSSNVQLALPVAMDTKRDYLKGAVIYYGDAPVNDLRTDLPLLFVRSGLDTPALNARIDALIGRALAANAPWSIENYGGGVHGFDIFDDNDVSREIIRKTLDFMDRVTTPSVAKAYAASAIDASTGAAFSRRDWPAAIGGYRAKIAAEPQNADAHLRLGLSLLESGNAKEALPSIEEAWRLGRQGPRDTAFPAARAAALSGNNDRALHWIDVLLATPFVSADDIRSDVAFRSIVETEAFTARMNAAKDRARIEALFLDRKTKEGLAELRKVKVGALASEGGLTGFAYRLLSRGAVDGAVAAFDLLVERFSRSANAWESRSEALERAGRKEEAVRDARRALKLNPAPNVRDAAEARVKRLTAAS